MNFPSLFSPLQVGPYRLNHRVVMAPLTRMRAEKPSLAPRPLNAEYYAPARHAGRPDHRRSLAGDGDRLRQSRRARHLFGSADRGLARRGRCGSCQGRPDLPAALACRAGLAFLVPARRRAAGRAFGGADFGRAEDHDRRRQGRGLRDAARAGDRAKSPASSTPSGRPRATRWRPASTASRSTAPTAI